MIPKNNTLIEMIRPCGTVAGGLVLRDRLLSFTKLQHAGVSLLATEQRSMQRVFLQQSQKCIHKGGSDDGPVEFCDVDLRVGGIDGVWHPGGLWNSPRGLRPDAPAAAAGCGEDPARSCARFLSDFSAVRRPFACSIAQEPNQPALTTDNCPVTAERCFAAVAVAASPA